MYEMVFKSDPHFFVCPPLFKPLLHPGCSVHIVLIGYILTASKPEQDHQHQLTSLTVRLLSLVSDLTVLILQEYKGI